MEQLVHQGKYHNSKQVCTALRTLGENRNIMIFFFFAVNINFFVNLISKFYAYLDDNTPKYSKIDLDW